MSKMYITFGQIHCHRINNNTLDCDSLGVIECGSESEGRAYAFEVTENGKFHQSYYEPSLEKLEEILQYFPRGIVEMGSA
jgi:hypothetical protein